MRRTSSTYLTAILVVSALSLSVGRTVYAASKDLVASERDAYEDDSTESLRDVLIRRDAESKEYKNKILSNNEESIRLLREIRELLRELNAKK